MITLYHHPWTRAAGSLWLLEELGLDYQLQFIDIQKGEHKTDEHVSRNGMGKLPVIKDGEVYVSESAAIGVYLADKYSLGELAPRLDDPQRGHYLRWCFYGPSVVEVGCYARKAKWDFSAGTAGWGDWDSMMSTLNDAVREGPYLFGQRFTMADCLLGGTISFMLQFKMIEPSAELTTYAAALDARPAKQRAQEINERVVEERGIQMPN